jgi:hypothetical protein
VEASRKMGIWPELVDDDAMRFEFPSASSKPVRGSIFKSLEWLFITCGTSCHTFALYEARDGMAWQATKTSDRVLYSTIIYLVRL